MIYSLNNNNFGRNIKKIREKLGLSLYDVSKQTGLKRQTISNIEKGTCIPRIDTLDLLSNAYKVNIYKLFDESRKVNDFTVLYNKLDLIIVNLNLKNLEEVCNEIKQFVEINIKTINTISKFELQSIYYFIEFINKVYQPTEISQDEIKGLLIHLDIHDIKNITHSFLENKLFTFIEYRLLMVLSMVLINSKNYDEGIALLTHCLDNLSNFVFDELSELHLKLKIYLNISYLYYLKGNYLISLEYSNKGIELATTNHSSYLLSQLFARRAVNKQKLNHSKDSIEEDYIKSVSLFYINNETILTKTYIDVFSTHHNLHIEILDHLKKYIQNICDFSKR
jgi:transcriptional regulator with XRE-family HTH domain